METICEYTISMRLKTIFNTSTATMEIPLDRDFYCLEKMAVVMVYASLFDAIMKRERNLIV